MSKLSDRLARVDDLVAMHQECIEKLDQLRARFLIDAGLWSWELEAMTKDMALPNQRKRDIHWLARNLPIQNRSHPWRARAMEAIKALLRSQNNAEPHV